MASAPETSIDIYSDEILAEPYEAYRQLRAMAPVVYVPAHNVYAVSRYDDVKALLSNWQDYTSRFGVSAVPERSGAFLLLSDPPEHDEMRNIISRPVGPGGLRVLEPDLKAEADALIERIEPGVPVEAVVSIARHLPVSIISKLVGLPEEGRERMLDWAFAAFNRIGPNNERRRTSEKLAREMGEYVHSVPKERLREGSWGRALYDAVERGELAPKYMPYLLHDYVGPALDTTIAGIINSIWCFASHPDQWRRLRAEPELMMSAVNEVLRLQSPVLGFGRGSTRATMIDGIDVPEGSRLIALYASANRDERAWDRPDDFVIDRKPNSHIAFGFGIHACMGMHLARLEMRLILEALARRFEHIELASTSRALNNSLRTFAELNVVFH